MVPDCNTIKATEPTLKISGDRYSYLEVSNILDGAETIWWTEEDNDSETWLVTRAGQFVRVCGISQDLFYVFDEDEAAEMLAGILEDAVWERLFGPMQSSAPLRDRSLPPSDTKCLSAPKMLKFDLSAFVLTSEYVTPEDHISEDEHI